MLVPNGKENTRVPTDPNTRISEGGGGRRDGVWSRDIPLPLDLLGTTIPVLFHRASLFHFQEPDA